MRRVPGETLNGRGGQEKHLKKQWGSRSSWCHRAREMCACGEERSKVKCCREVALPNLSIPADCGQPVCVGSGPKPFTRRVV